VKEQLILTPIGTIRTSFQEKYEAPRQPGLHSGSSQAVIILHEGKNFEQALTDLDGFEKIWLIYWFHQNQGWKPMVQVPRGPKVKHGVFATRSPHRPNPIGISLVTLERVSGRKIWISNHDLLDGTPILDIKPYIPYIEAVPEARAGWTDIIDQNERTILWGELSKQQAQFLSNHYTNNIVSLIESRLLEIELDDKHPYTRIKKLGQDRYELALKSWRIEFTVQALEFTIVRFRSGYTQIEKISDSEEQRIHDLFTNRWPE